MKFSLDILNKVDLKELQPYALGVSDVEFLSPPGHSHYPLLAHISEQFNNLKIIEIGTYYGWASLCLAKNKTNKVITYDLRNHITELKVSDKKPYKSILDIENIVFKQKNFLDDLEELKDTKIIFLDVDPHDGIQEFMIFNALKENNYNGILLLDDILLNQGMRDFWYNIDLPKENITQFGHYSGTGIVFFNRKS